MARGVAYVLTGILLLTSMVAAALLGPGAAGQEATPGAGQQGPPEQFEIAPGVTVDNMVFAEGQEAPPIYRLTFAPGVEYQVQPSMALELAYVEGGTLVLELDAPISVGQLPSADAAGNTLVAGMPVSVTAGQYFVIPPGAGGVVRNEGDEPAVVSVAGIVPASEASQAATPAG
jgi:quercetin dioxygenase-like cupin family protein